MINKLFRNNNHSGVQNDSAHDVSTYYKKVIEIFLRIFIIIIIIVNVIGNLSCIN